MAPTALQRVERLQGLSSTLKELKATSARRQASALGGMPTQSRRAAVVRSQATLRAAGNRISLTTDACNRGLTDPRRADRRRLPAEQRQAAA